MALNDAHAVGLSRAGSVSRFRVDRPAALDALESLDASVRLELGSWVGGRRVSACNLRTLEAEKVERVSMHRSR